MTKRKGPDELAALIGGLMGDKPVRASYIMNRDESGSCLFTNATTSRADLERWLEEKTRDHPEYIERSGYHLVDRDEWPDYLQESADASRFINWALRQSGAWPIEEFVERMGRDPGVNLQGLLADALVCRQGRPELSPFHKV